MDTCGVGNTIGTALPSVAAGPSPVCGLPWCSCEAKSSFSSDAEDPVTCLQSDKTATGGMSGLR